MGGGQGSRPARAGLLRSLLLAAAVAAGVFASSAARSDDGLTITGLTDRTGTISNPAVGLNDYLAVRLSGTAPLAPERYVLFLDGRAMDGLDDTLYQSDGHALLFHLRRNSTNATAWAALLGSPDWQNRRISVALGEKKPPPATAQPTITTNGGAEPQFSLVVLSGTWLAFAALAVLAVGILVWGGATRTTILKDNLLPQMPPHQQPYSLARWQMAFWFTLVFASFVFLFVLLFDYNTVTEQALTLMGISGGTALAAVAIDATKDSRIGAANATLQALGLNAYADVVKVRSAIAERTAILASNPPPDDATKLRLQSEVADRLRLLRTYEDVIRPFASEGWYRDLMTDINGPALHRLQVFCWTWILGAVFVFGVYRNFAMPQFNGTLLALMAITGAGYVGFKYPEKQ
jgi:hypothetical protein